MTTELIDGKDHLVESFRKQLLFSPVFEGEQEAMNAEVSVEIDSIDFRTGVLETTSQVDGAEIERADYLPQLLGWTDPEHTVDQISLAAADEIYDIIEDDLGWRPPCVQAIKAPNQLEYFDPSEPAPDILRRND